MQPERFDALSRLIGARTSLRTAVALAATGLLSLSVPDVEAARCSKKKRCPKCKRCKKEPCKPDARQNGEACEGVSGGTCHGGTCCLGLGVDCTDAKQCCQNAGKTACAPLGNLNQDQCCRPTGATCSTPGAWQECCLHVFDPGVSGGLIYCAPNNTCGGPGARCYSGDLCASGVCCGGFDPLSSKCCAAGQQCVNDQCVG